MGLAIYFAKAFRAARTGQITPVNLRALAKFFSDCKRAGVAPSRCRAMVDLFFIRRWWKPEVPAWKSFIARREQLYHLTQGTLPDSPKEIAEQEAHQVAVNEKALQGVLAQVAASRRSLRRGA
jgi:hypothetical protein